MRLALALVLVPALAAAEPPGLTPPLPPAPEQPLVESYRAQTLAADGLAVVLAVAAGENHTPGLGSLALGTYALGAPLVHLAHGRPTRALGSLALRVGLPVLTTGLLAASHRDSCSPAADICDDDSELGVLLLGIFGSVIAASVIDTAFLAKGDDPPPARSWTPTLAPTRGGGFTLGVGGAF